MLFKLYLYWATFRAVFGEPLGGLFEKHLAALMRPYSFPSFPSSWSEALVSNLIGISSYIHASGVRTRELKKLATQRGLVYVRIPAVFEVRWTEFSLALVHAILVSWFALVSYFTDSSDFAAKGHLKCSKVRWRHAPPRPPNREGLRAFGARRSGVKRFCAVVNTA